MSLNKELLNIAVVHRTRYVRELNETPIMDDTDSGFIHGQKIGYDDAMKVIFGNSVWNDAIKAMEATY